MDLFSKLSTALRGGVREAGEAVIDANALRIFQQEIVDCEAAIAKAKQDLAHIKAEKVRLNQDLSQLQEALGKREQQARLALTKGEDALAEELAGHIAEQEQAQADLTSKRDQVAAQERKLTASLQGAAKRVADYRRELRLLQATGSSQAANQRLSAKTTLLGTSFGSLEQSLERIKATQQNTANQMQALAEVESELADGGLDGRLRQAGIGPADAAQQVLQRLRQKVAE